MACMRKKAEKETAVRRKQDELIMEVSGVDK
jgi:hypothetical protein